MSDPIEPALTPVEWAFAQEKWDWRTGEPLTGVGIGYTNGDFPITGLHNPYTPTQLIALLNFALPDTDPRKITRDWVRAMRDLANAIESAQGSKMVGAIRLTGPAGTTHVSTGNDWRGMADALESYLPPEAAP